MGPDFFSDVPGFSWLSVDDYCALSLHRHLHSGEGETASSCFTGQGFSASRAIVAGDGMTGKGTDWSGFVLRNSPGRDLDQDAIIVASRAHHSLVLE